MIKFSDDEDEEEDLLEKYREEVTNILLDLNVLNREFNNYLENTSSFNDF